MHPDQFKEQTMKNLIKPLDSSLESERPLPEYVVNGIKKAEEDMKSGHSISLEAFKKKLSITN